MSDERRKNSVKYVYKINEMWAFTIMAFFQALFFLLADMKYLVPIMSVNIVISVVTFCLSFQGKKTVQKFYKKLDCYKDIPNFMSPICSDIRIFAAAFIIFIISTASYLILRLAPSFYTLYPLDSFIVCSTISLCYIIHTLVMLTVNNILRAIFGYELSASKYYRCRYRVKNLDYIKTNIAVLAVSFGLITYKIYYMDRLITMESYIHIVPYL